MILNIKFFFVNTLASKIKEQLISVKYERQNLTGKKQSENFV